MGLLDGILKVAAPVVGGIFGGPAGAAIGGALGGALGSGNSTQTATSTSALDPRAAGILYGQNGQGGILNQYTAMLNKQQDPAMQAFGQANSNYLAGASPDAMAQMRQAGTSLLSGGSMASVPSYMQGTNVNAPAQNGIDLSGAYQSMVYGDPAANPYLTGAIQKGINQSQNAFGSMQDSATRNLMQNIMPGIRSNSVLAGQYGGSRQGVAEGNAIGDFARAQQQQIGQFGQSNTDAAVAAQAGAYDSGQNRALSAMQGLGAQQYGVASQNAGIQNAAEQTNVNNQLDVSKYNAGLDLAGKQAGAGILGGLTNAAYSVGTNQDQYGLNNATKVNSLIAPYLGMGGSQTTSSPLYQNQTGNMLGGAMLGGSLFGGGGSIFDQFTKNAYGQGKTGGGPAGTQYDGYGYMPANG